MSRQNQRLAFLLLGTLLLLGCHGNQNKQETELDASHTREVGNDVQPGEAWSDELANSVDADGIDSGLPLDAALAAVDEGTSTADSPDGKRTGEAEVATGGEGGSATNGDADASAIHMVGSGGRIGQGGNSQAGGATGSGGVSGSSNGSGVLGSGGVVGTGGTSWGGINIVFRSILGVGGQVPASDADAGIEAGPWDAQPNDNAAADSGSEAECALAEIADAPSETAVGLDGDVADLSEERADDLADVGQTTLDVADPCAGRQVDDGGGIFVSPDGVDETSCGTREMPCRTIQTGIASALAAARSFVYVAPGLYVEAISLVAGVSLEGGWLVEGDAWVADCSDQASASTVIQAPSNQNITILADELGGASAVRRITVLSKAQPDVLPGESLYGFLARGATTGLTIEDVVVTVVSAGAGANGEVGIGSSPFCLPPFYNSFPIEAIPATGCNSVADVAAPPSPIAGYSGTCSPAQVPGGSVYWPNSGTLGTSGSDGLGGSFEFMNTGYVPSDGSPGFDGGIGGIGQAGGSYNIGTCWPVSNCNSEGCIGWCPTTPGGNCNNHPGVPGCGGKGGGGGMPGHGGGSSFALYVWDAQVSLIRSIFNSGDGGNGGNGGPGGCGWGGAPGRAGQSIPCHHATLVASGSTGAERRCRVDWIQELPGGAPGGAGGPGGPGGWGGPGGGGWSCAYFQGGSGVVDVSASSFSHGLPGQGGAPSGSPGLASDTCGGSSSPDSGE